MKVLITGGAGFIGSTVASACLDDGIVPVVLDNLVTGRAEFVRDRPFYHGDVADAALIDRVFAEHPDIEAVVHCAALIVVPESVRQPTRYYRENVAKTLALLDGLARNGCRRFLFSSSASIYRPDEDFSVDEGSVVDPQSPYARTKAAVEWALADCAGAGDVRAISLRYFNPIGADPRLRTGLQIPRPTHVLGKLIEAAETGERFHLTGADWPTRDGSGIRDYIHVWDLARAHVHAIRRFDEVCGPDRDARYEVINLGTGDGVTVRELLRAFEGVIGRSIETIVTDRRPGDTVGSFTRSDKARSVLGWRPEYSIEDGIRHSLAWSAKRESVLAAEPVR